MNVLNKEKVDNLPVVKRMDFPRDEFSLGSLERKIKDLGGKILLLRANYRNWKVTVKF